MVSTDTLSDIYKKVNGLDRSRGYSLQENTRLSHHTFLGVRIHLCKDAHIEIHACTKHAFMCIPESVSEVRDGPFIVLT